MAVTSLEINQTASATEKTDGDNAMNSEKLLCCVATVLFVISFDHSVSVEATIAACSACIIRAIKEIKE